MLVMDPYPGYEGKYFSMPCRNLVPKSVQKPHPPLWVACSKRETIHQAARHGIGALTFAFVDQSEAVKWVKEYYDIIKSEECVPIGHAVNANIAMVAGFSCHADAEEARRRGLDGFRFFGYALGHHYIFGEHTPGRTSIWANYEKARDILPVSPGAGGIGTPDEIAANMRRFEEAGLDQVIFLQQGGKNEHAHICASLELFAKAVMPAFKAAPRGTREARSRRSWRPTSSARWPASSAGRHCATRTSRPSSRSAAAGAAGVRRRQDRQLRPRQRDAGAAGGPAEEGVEIDTWKRGC